MKKKSSNPIFSLRVFLGLLIVLTEVVFVDYFASAAMEFVLSSAMVTVALLIQLRFGLREDAGTPADIVVFIFDWLFLDWAPKVQLLSMPQQLVNTSSVTIGTVAITNLLCALFIVTFTGAYHFLSNRSRAPRAREAEAQASPAPFTAGAIGITLFICVAVVGLAAPHAYKTADAVTQSSPVTLIVGRYLLFIPSAALLILLNETIRGGRKWVFSRICAVSLLVVLVLISENPYTEKRNALGPIYIGMILTLFAGWFAGRTRRLALLVLSMIVIFPVSSIFTHNRDEPLSSLTASRFWDEIELHYFSVNYDSWANIYTCVEIVKVHSLQWGHQLLGSLLFFVPSSLWTDKPLATGIFIADYLIANYSMWFTNLSAPLIGEGYLDFGYAGVVVYAGILAVFVMLLNKLALRRDKWLTFPMAIYASVFLMIVLRGSLMIALGFASAAFLAFCTASALLSMKAGVRHRHSTARHMSARASVAS
ncbi:MAG: hypothetical protein WBF89_06730 [Steroidobacteraceae bacterium]